MKAYTCAGYRVTFERFRPGGRAATEVMGVKSHWPSVARQQAAKKSGFIRVLKLEPLSAEQYAEEFPSGQHGRTGRFISVRA